MGTRGRASTAALIIAKPLDSVERQPAPHDLTDEETEIWAAVVNAEPADWLSPSSVPLLVQYCRHSIAARKIAELIEKGASDLDPETKQPTMSIKDYDRLLGMQERESRAIATLAQKLRISPHSQTNHRGNKIAKAVKKPWEG